MKEAIDNLKFKKQSIKIKNRLYLNFIGNIINYDINEYKDSLEYIINLIGTLYNNNFEFFVASLLPYINTWSGEWSIVIVDIETNEIILFTDPLGKKSLYINHFGEISNRINDLISEESKYDESYMSTIRKFGYNIDERTPYNNIKKIPSNCILKYSIEQPSFFNIYKNYYNGWNNPIDSLRGATYDGYMDWLWDHMYLIIKQYLDINKNKTNKILVSGGLDSSIIASILVGIDKQNVKFYSIENNETDYVNALSLHLDIPINILSYSMDKEEFKTIYKEYNETPVDLGSVIPQYYLFKELNGSNSVITGDGADELFGGYNRINEYDSQKSDIFDELTFYHLPRIDKISTLFEVECFCPFLDLELIRFAINLPLEYRKDKKILKDCFKSLLPPSIVNREKKALKNPSIVKDKIKYRDETIALFKSI